jgi:hypothetical protein
MFDGIAWTILAKTQTILLFSRDLGRAGYRRKIIWGSVQEADAMGGFRNGEERLKAVRHRIANLVQLLAKKSKHPGNNSCMMAPVPEPRPLKP